MISTLTTVVIGFCILSIGAAQDWSKVIEEVEHYRKEGAYTGAVLRVANGTHTLFAQTFGSYSHIDLPLGAPFITNDTIFDIASLSKVTATLSCIIWLVEEGKIGVDDKVVKYIPEYGNNGKEQTTLRNLLLHNAGLLPDYPPPLPKTKKEFMEWVYTCPLDYPIATKMVYSDLSFILLAEIAERVTQKSIDVLTKERM